MNALMQAIRETLEQAGLWRDGAVLLCALSGGCDSTALVHAACRLRAQKDLHIHAVHVQHGLRGEESAGDEAFVRDLCRCLNVPLAVADAGLCGTMQTPGMETMARESRRRIFESELNTLNADALLTAHHQDDQAETVLMHLLRGSGMNGLCGMHASVPFGRAQMLRPFLHLSRQQLCDALTAENLSFREDASNQQAITPRNALRLEILPRLEKLFPASAAHTAQAAALIAEDEAYLSAEADRLYQHVSYAAAPLFMLRLEPLLHAPRALTSRVLRRWFADGLAAAQIHSQEQSLSCGDTLALCALLTAPAGSRLNLPCALAAVRQQNWLHLIRQSGEPLQMQPDFAVAVDPETTHYQLPHLTLHAAQPFRLPQDASSVILSREWLNRAPCLRLMQSQDVIRPFGAPGHKPLRRCFTDRKADPFLRRAWPVLCAGSEVLWIPGLCASEHLRTVQWPSDGIQLTLTGETPLIFNPPKE